MRKFGKLTAIALVFVLALGLVACGKKEQKKVTDSSANNDATVEKEDKPSNDSENDYPDTEVVSKDSNEESTGNLLKIGVSTYNDYTLQDETYEQLAYTNIDKISVLNAGSKYQALAEKVAAYSDGCFNAANEEYENLKKYATSDGSEDSAAYLPYFNSLSYSVFRADDKALSVLLHTSEHSGGAHPNHGVSSNVFDSVTGSFLSPSDVITDKDAFVSLIAEQAVANAGEEIEDPTAYISEAFDNGSLTWVLTYNGVDVYFSPYEIASYAAGYIITSVSFKEHPEIFNSKYTSVPENYTFSVASESNVAVDTDGDGVSEKLQIWNSFNPEIEDMHELSIMRDGESFISDSEFYNFSYRLMFVHQGGKNYLFVDGSSYNAYHEIRVYDLATGKRTDDLTGVSLNYYTDKDDYTSINEVVCDPGKITFVERVDALCTAFTSREYKFESGKLIPLSEMLRYDRGEHSFKNAVGLTVDVCDEEGNVSGTLDVHPGETFTFRYTDNSTYVIATLSDGTYVKLNMNNSSWPQHVNDMELEEVFPDADFAG